MKKIGAVGILTTMLMGFLTWASGSIIQNKVDISKIDVKEKNNHELLREMRGDIKVLLQRSK